MINLSEVKESIKAGVAIIKIDFSSRLEAKPAKKELKDAGYTVFSNRAENGLGSYVAYKNKSDMPEWAQNASMRLDG